MNQHMELRFCFSYGAKKSCYQYARDMNVYLIYEQAGCTFHMIPNSIVKGM